MKAIIDLLKLNIKMGIGYYETCEENIARPPQAGIFFRLVVYYIKIANLWQNNDHASGFLGQNWVRPYIYEIYFCIFQKRSRTHFGPEKKDFLFNKKEESHAFSSNGTFSLFINMVYD